MSIIISNISDTYSRKGEQEYIIHLNRIPLATYTHQSEDGMAECLRKAATALEGIDIELAIKEHRLLQGGYRGG